MCFDNVDQIDVDVSNRLLFHNFITFNLIATIPNNCFPVLFLENCAVLYIYNEMTRSILFKFIFSKSYTFLSLMEWLFHSVLFFLNCVVYFKRGIIVSILFLHDL